MKVGRFINKKDLLINRVSNRYVHILEDDFTVTGNNKVLFRIVGIADS